MSNPNASSNHTGPVAGKLELKKQLITTLLALGSALVGIAVTQHYAQDQWHKEKIYTIETDLLSRRFSLLDRFLKVSRREGEPNTLKFLIENDLRDVTAAAANKDTVTSLKLIRDSEDDLRRMDDLRAEYLAVLTLSAAMFGPKTQNAIQNLMARHNPNVWEANEEEKAAIVEAMSSELGWGIPDVPVNTTQTFSVPRAKP